MLRVCLEGPRKLGTMLAGLWAKVRTCFLNKKESHRPQECEVQFLLFRMQPSWILVHLLEYFSGLDSYRLADLLPFLPVFI